MGLKIGKIASLAYKIGSNMDLSSLGNINVGGISPSNIGSIKGTIESTIDNKISNLENQLVSSITPSDIESMGKEFDIEGKTAQLQAQLESTANSQSIDESSIESMMNQLGLNDINNIGGLSNINFM